MVIRWFLINHASLIEASLSSGMKVWKNCKQSENLYRIMVTCANSYLIRNITFRGTWRYQYIILYVFVWKRNILYSIIGTIILSWLVHLKEQNINGIGRVLNPSYENNAMFLSWKNLSKRDVTFCMLLCSKNNISLKKKVEMKVNCMWRCTKVL